ncbi:MAG: phosphoribosylamine--glycine ligase [Thaumarchaeota archaeon]|nr:phosphoribosylamine--glycine ligase [Nitrososphaerota archaeon]
MSDVLIIGNGGREHALGWKLNQSPHVKKTFFASGNGGTSENISISPNEINKLLDFAKKKKCFIVVGPEEPLSKGIVNSFENNGLTIFGPRKEAAELETSKVWAKNFMKKYEIKTACFRTFSNIEQAKDYVQKNDKKLVVKANGIVAGKGVIVCNSKQEAFEALERIMVRKEFGDAGSSVVIEEQLCGEEISFITMTDGKTIIPLASSQDHKRIYNDDKGPNTGGMGAYSPTPLVDEKLHDKIMINIMQKTISGMKNENRKFRGFLYAGIMIKDGEPYVLEFNVRMGDPECQSIMMRMESDLYKYMEYCVNDKLDELEYMRWSKRSAACVVMASKGYPRNYEKGKKITGLDKIITNTVSVFHAGTACNDGQIVTNGGRVFGVTAVGNGIENTIKNVYNAVSKITWDGVYYRTDIGKKALMYLTKI